MSDGLYVSMCGATARSDQLDAIADNLANAQTPGFRPSRPAFESFLPAGGAPDKVYAAAVGTGVSLKPGPAVRTGNPLDVYPEDGAFLAVRGADGATAYTRDGRMTLDAERRLTAGGRLVLSTRGEPITVPPERTATVDRDGVVRAGDLELGEVARVQLQGPADRLGPSVVVPAPGGTASPVSAPLRGGEVELGTGSALEGMVELISAQRQFDSSMQALQTYRQLDQRSTDVGRVR
ncbi:flagellar hook-basal body complex protein [Anaeromyxobacter paludicola]|uniref:Flagellar basal-body rod protein FlgF n=1 Tax=Anaeromyxobacter paludicola TaxID=2918171 RepID=A0ABN6N4A5_9BACT|nr:flagellar hook-basal body complex protein [Anaeromyxobacter paludicola]BDG08004.1 flagellar basal-body rod protein FlgF [Anaeromyxobacter paludicola]